MNAQTNTTKKGFTIIEVVLVLAIAGLIFLMVFIALPALQRSQRDEARKRDVSSVAAAVTNFTSNNRGAFPTTAQLSGQAETSGNIETVTIGNRGAGVISPDENTITVTERSVCGTSTSTNQTLTAGTARQFTVVTKLEAGNDGSYFCLDS
jgi:prepilin-type N-terminal cleavage/methylation domain-containing protein